MIHTLSPDRPMFIRAPDKALFLLYWDPAAKEPALIAASDEGEEE